MTDNHAAGFRPSHFGALGQCIHHESKEGDSEACQRGTDIHGIISDVLKTGLPAQYHPEIITAGQTALNPSAEAPVKWAAKKIEDYRAYGWRIHAVEVEVDLQDDMGEVITRGTIDLVLERNGEYLIVDWKTGDKSDYTHQVGSYIMAWWDRPGRTVSVEGLIFYVDLQETESVSLSYALCSKRVLDLYDRWSDPRRKDQPYVINDYCNWCAVRGDCPAWRQQASVAALAVQQLAGDPKGLPDPRALLQTKVDNLKNNPKDLEKFLLAWARAESLVEDWKLKSALKTHIETGYKAEHYTLVTRKAVTEIVQSIDSEEFLERVAHHIGYMQAAPAITVDPDKAQEAWRLFYGITGEVKFPAKITETITETPGFSYLRAKGKKGQGDARAKRKELE